jgi:FkbM family methyltransferase
MNRFFVRFINWYACRFRFPTRGLKYFIAFLRKRGLLQHPFLTRDRDGILFRTHLEDHVQRYLFWYGSYEPVELAIAQAVLQLGDVVLDIGANIGNYSLTAAKAVGTSGSIYSFEPSTATFLQLQENIRLNGLQTIHAIQAAVGNSPGLATLYVSANDNIGMTSLQPADNFSDVVEQVKLITIDDFVRKTGIPQVSLIKIDIEGSELAALQGMLEVLTRHQPLLMVEINAATLARFGTAPSALYGFLQSLGYQPYEIIDSKTIRLVNDMDKEADLMLFATSKHRIAEKLDLLGTSSYNQPKR